MTEPHTSWMALSADERYTYCLDVIAEKKQLWGLSDGDTWVLASLEDEECWPVWPTEELAQCWAASLGDETARPKAVELGVWLDKWLPGMTQDGLSMAVFPGEGDDVMVVSASEFSDALNALQS